MENRTNKNQMKYLVSVAAALVFLAAAYSIPAETFFGLFAAGLFLIPAMIFVYIVQKVGAA